ncbi:MAG TPA: O-antigen ligase family protein [Novosphingobium sp.]|nr:O-antigen ligase family protein [Novosphingobium sp.]
MTTATPTADPAAGPLSPPSGSTGQPAARVRLSAVERRAAWARHRREMTRLITAKADWVPVLIFASILMTPEARIDLGGFQLYPYRLALLAALPMMLVRLAKRPVRLGPADLLITASSMMMLIAMALRYPLDVALKTGGGVTMDALLAYFAGRIFFRSSLDVRRFLYRISPLLLGVAIVMALESVSHRYLLRPFVGAVTGFYPDAALARMYEIRLGLLRATGPFLHPIAAGLFFGSLVPLFYSADLPKWRWLGLLGCLGGVFGWSSAGIVAISAGLGLGLYDSFQRRYRVGWGSLLLALLFGAVLIEALSGGGFVKFVIRYAALNPQTGYFRLLIWEYGWANVAKSPWIGIGYFESYERPVWMRSDSVDNYWLLQALRYGLPSMAMLLVGVFLIIFKLGVSRQGQELGSLNGRRMATGLCISLATTVVSLLTSSPWGADMAWLTVVFGMAAGLADKSEPPRSRAAIR